MENKIEKVRNLIEITISLLNHEIIDESLRLSKMEDAYEILEAELGKIEEQIDETTTDEKLLAEYDEIVLKNNIEIDLMDIVRDNIIGYGKAIKELEKIKSNYIGD